MLILLLFFFSSRRRHTRLQGDWSSDVCSSDLLPGPGLFGSDVHRAFVRRVRELHEGPLGPLEVITNRREYDPLTDRPRIGRSEERRVGKEWRSGGPTDEEERNRERNNGGRTAR